MGIDPIAIGGAKIQAGSIHLLVNPPQSVILVQNPDAFDTVRAESAVDRNADAVVLVDIDPARAGVTVGQMLETAFER